MGNKKKDHDGELFDMLRATGLRRKVARTVSKSTARANGGQSSDALPVEVAHKTVRGLRMAASAIENRVPGNPTGHARNAASTSRTKKRSAAGKRAPSGPRGSSKKVTAPTRTARKTARPTTRKASQRQAATRNRRTTAR